MGELAFERLPQSFVRGQAGAMGTLCGRRPFLTFTAWAGCFPPCPARGEEVGKERRMVEGAISSFSNGVREAGRKAGEHEIHVQENQH